MATELKALPLVVIVGPTASGKTALAVDIARHHDGEIIAADSRTVFREMNIGTAKPTIEEQAGVPHWGLDLVEPGQRYTAAAFQRYANHKVAEIKSRGRLPILVGGTGLYIDGVIYDYKYPAEPSQRDRRRFEAMDVEQLYRYCLEHNIELPINDKNRRHLIRKIVHKGIADKRSSCVLSNTLVFGIAVDKATLRTRIHNRIEQMFDNGVVDEARRLGKKYGWDSESMTGSVYPLLREYIDGASTLDDAKRAFATRDWQLAKRQMTWFRRNPEICWGTADDVHHRVNDVLASG